MRHNDKIFNLIQLIDRKKFDALAEKWSMDKGVRKFSTFNMTRNLILTFLLKLDSFREIEAVLGTPDSTFGDALRKRSFGFFEELCDLVLLQIRSASKDGRTKKAINELLAIDSSECRVHGSLFSVPGWKQKSSTGHVASAKLHTVWNVDGGWIEDFRVTGNRSSDLTIGKCFAIESNKTYVFDRAYVDLGYWLKIESRGSHFVTRLKKGLRTQYTYKYIGLKDDPRVGVLWDNEWTPSEGTAYKHGFRPKQIKFRHIIYRDPESRKVFDFVTSDRKTSADDIAAIYKKRWSVELLYRWLKSHLNIRYLAVKNTNAVKIQLAIAVLVQLLLRLQKIKTSFTGSLWELLRGIRTSLLRESLSLIDVAGNDSIETAMEELRGASP